MNFFLRSFCFALILLVTFTDLGRSQGYIVFSGVTYASSNLFGEGYGINVVHNPTNGEATGFAFMPTGLSPFYGPHTNIFRFDPMVDVGVRVFFTSATQAITTASVLSGDMTELSYSTSYILIPNTPFYLALYTGNMQFAPPNGIYENPIFGWVKLNNNQGVIEMLDGAIEYGGAGIYAGTQTIIQSVPEPSTFALLGLSGVLICFRRFNYRPQ